MRCSISHICHSHIYHSPISLWWMERTCFAVTQSCMVRIPVTILGGTIRLGRCIQVIGLSNCQAISMPATWCSPCVDSVTAHNCGKINQWRIGRRLWATFSCGIWQNVNEKKGHAYVQRRGHRFSIALSHIASHSDIAQYQYLRFWHACPT